MSSDPISLFTDHYNDYLLQLKTTKEGKKELGVIKKGIWTWLKIHIGSHLGLFDMSTIKLNEIAPYVIANDFDRPYKFYDLLDYKIIRWNARHPKIEEYIKTKTGAADPSSVNSSEAQVNKSSPFHAWLEKARSEVIKEVRKKLPQGCYTKVDILEGQNIHLIKLHPSLASRSRSEFLGFPNPAKILLYFKGDYSDEVGKAELEKADHLLQTLNITFGKDKTNADKVNVCVRIV